MSTLHFRPRHALALALLAHGAAQAELFDRGGGLIYDSTLNITWLQDANYAKTSGYDADGVMTWPEAMRWAAGLAYFDSVRNQTITGWRLPLAHPVNGVSWQYDSTTDGSTDRSYNITSPAHEYAHLFHVDLGNLSFALPDGTPIPGNSGTAFGMVHSGPFINTQNAIYWYGMLSPFDATAAGGFLGYSGGSIATLVPDQLFFAWAVHDGDVGAVPEPAPAALLGCGLALLAWRRRRAT